MNRGTPMKRTAFKRHEATPKARTEVKAKARKCVAPECGTRFTPTRMGQRVCGPACAMVVGRIKAEKQREAEAKADFHARKEKLKTITQWEHECKAIVQKIARLRDRNDGCISCHMGPDYRGQWHGSHFRPAGNHAATELHLWNIHKSCAQCNKYKGGNIAGYRPRLIEKIGLDRVEWLESQNQPVKRAVDYLHRFKKVMGKRLRRMEKRIAA